MELRRGGAPPSVAIRARNWSRLSLVLPDIVDYREKQYLISCGAPGDWEETVFPSWVPDAVSGAEWYIFLCGDWTDAVVHCGPRKRGLGRGFMHADEASAWIALQCLIHNLFPETIQEWVRLLGRRAGRRWNSWTVRKSASVSKQGRQRHRPS